MFDPATGIVVAVPDGAGPGHWAGAPGAWSGGEEIVLTYRLRAPLPRRGHTLVVPRSRDGVAFETVRSIAREELSALSIERSAIVRDADRWRLYVSFVDARDRRWRIEAIEADSLEALDPRARHPVLRAEAIGVAGVKDPWVRRHAGRRHLFVSFGEQPVDAAGLHASGDALSTGRTRSLSGLATSADGRAWEWHGAVLEPSPGRWDAYTSRLTTAVRVGAGWVGLYDGGTLEGNYEERCGLAYSEDLVRWRKDEANGPAIGTAAGPGGVRYVDVVEMPGGRLRAFYEWTREDGSHELRTADARRP